MITREQLRELAEIESPEGVAVSFYFQPTRPQNKSHRDELIRLKDLVRGAMKRAGGAARVDLERILERAEQLHADHAHAKAIFACSAKGTWREFNLPPKLAASTVVLNSRFHLSPLVTALDHLLRCAVALVNREKSHIVGLGIGDTPEEVISIEEITSEAPRRVRTDGFAGYQAGHIERHIDNEAMRHFKYTAERLKDIVETRAVEQVVMGCRDEIWLEIESQLHSYVRQRLVGRFPADPATTSLAEIRDQVEKIIFEQRASEREALVREVLGEAQRDGRGVTGLRNVLLSLERGEVQTLLIANSFSAPGVECRNCGHLDSRASRQCDVCGRETTEVENLLDVLVSRAIRTGGVEIVHVSSNGDFARAGNIGALLRFRADQNTAQKLAS
jgi:peptide subunit release factor 1 (eRF1)